MIDIKGLRLRYKQILNKNQSQESETDKENQQFIKTNKPNFKQRLLTQYSSNTSASVNDKFYHNQTIIKLKQRIAQNVKIIAQKDQELQRNKEQCVRLEQKVLVLNERLAEEHQKIINLQHKIMNEKIDKNSLQKQIENKNKKNMQEKLDKQILLSQIQFYKKQISGLKASNKSLVKKIQKYQKDESKSDLLKSEIGRLKQDVKRMHVFINEYSLNNKSVNFNNKHFVGICMKQMNNWVSNNLYGQLELFLKKEQINAGKGFVDNMVRFINKYTQSFQSQGKKQNVNKNKTKKSSVKQTRKNSHYRSSSLIEDSQSIMKRTDCMTQSSIKKTTLLNKCKKIQSRMYTQNLNLFDKSKTDKTYCSQIFDEYQSILKQALNEKQIKIKNVLLLGDQLRKNICSLMNSKLD